jgi:hypothetical protein
MDEGRRKSKDFILESATSLIKVLLNSPATEIVLDTIVDIVVTSVTEDGGKLYIVVRGERWWWWWWWE